MVICLTPAIVGCSSPINWEPVAAEDRSTSGVRASDWTVATSTSVQNAVAPVNLGNDAAMKTLAAVGGTVCFEYDSCIVWPEYQPIMEASAKLMQADTSRDLTIDGHTDEHGGREYNFALGQQHTEAVRRVVAILDVMGLQMEAVSFVKEKPALVGTTENAMVKNRRTGINIR